MHVHLSVPYSAAGQLSLFSRPITGHVVFRSTASAALDLGGWNLSLRGVPRRRPSRRVQAAYICKYMQSIRRGGGRVNIYVKWRLRHCLPTCRFMPGLKQITSHPRVMQRLFNEANFRWCRSCELCPTGPTSLQPDEARCAEYAPNLPHLGIARLMGLTQPQVSPSCPSTPAHPFRFSGNSLSSATSTSSRSLLPCLLAEGFLARLFSPHLRLTSGQIPAVDQPSGQGHRNRLTYPTASTPSRKSHQKHRCCNASLHLPVREWFLLRRLAINVHRPRFSATSHPDLQPIPSSQSRTKLTVSPDVPPRDRIQSAFAVQYSLISTSVREAQPSPEARSLVPILRWFPPRTLCQRTIPAPALLQPSSLTFLPIKRTPYRKLTCCSRHF
ncbi:hypothetical protein GE09DRAFT_754585 [Coniochaeta sp. 2T2.1]|nr:hypothetical protein GE09DRAFT_754585 [Coniochaeta sp. 2T2.1]